jgi:hypothetical protein
MHHPFHTLWFVCLDNISWSVKVTKFFSLWTINIFLSTLFSDTLTLCHSSINTVLKMIHCLRCRPVLCTGLCTLPQELVICCHFTDIYWQPTPEHCITDQLRNIHCITYRPTSHNGQFPSLSYNAINLQRIIRFSSKFTALVQNPPIHWMQRMGGGGIRSQ